MRANMVAKSEFKEGLEKLEKVILNGHNREAQALASQN